MEPPSHGLLQDAGSPPQAGRFRPYASTRHRVTRGRYITSNDRRGYIPVYEYPLNGQWIMMDIDDGYILWTGIWKALGNAKADIVKMLESQPDLAPQLRRVRGGYLKIQGTWMPYEVALRLARRVAWTIREDLIPLFGPTFPSTCLTPDQPGYGQILGNQQGKRRGRRAAVPLPLSAGLPPPQPSDIDTSQGDTGQQTRQPGPSSLPPLSAVATGDHPSHLLSPSQIAGPSGTRHDDYRDEGRYPAESFRNKRYAFTPLSSQLSSHSGHGYHPPFMAPPPVPPYGQQSTSANQYLSSSSGPIRDSATVGGTSGSRERFSPYQNVGTSRHRPGSAMNSAFRRPSPVDLPPLTIPSSRQRAGSGADTSTRSSDTALVHVASNSGTSVPVGSAAAASRTLPTAPSEIINLPPIHAHSSALSDISRRRSSSFYSSGSGSGYSLPPISSLSNLPPPSSGSSSYQFDSAVVLRRLALDDETLGRSRQASFDVAGDSEGSHRDDRDDDDSHTIDPPTEEQLWKRRRSLSEPPSQPDTFPTSQPAWSAAPDIGLNPSSGILPPRVPSSSFPASAVFTGKEVNRRGAWSPPIPSGRSGPPIEHYQDLHPSKRLKGESTPAAQEVHASSFASLSRIEPLRERYGVTSSDDIRNRDVLDEDSRTPRSFTASMPAAPWRPHTESRTSSPLGYHTHEGNQSLHMNRPQQPGIEFSTYHFGASSPSRREDAQSLTPPGGRGSRNDRAQADRFHSPPPHLEDQLTKGSS